MKAIRAVFLILAVAFVLASCSSLAQGAVGGALGALTGGVVTVGGGGGGAVATGAVAASVDFQSGEILCTTAIAEIGERFRVARVLTPASAATKNQAEVIWVSDGRKEWVNFIVNSRKAAKADMVVGASVFVCENWDDISADDYRKRDWSLLTVTSVDQLYKGRVEVSGDSFMVDFIRVPTDPVK